MYPFGILRQRELMPLIAGRQRFYESPREADAIHRYQLRQFNEQWQQIVQDVPFYSELQRQCQLPDVFESLEDFRDRMPTMGREIIQSNRRAMTSTARSPDGYRATGGSTGEPIQFPAWNSEQEISKANAWYGRSLYGIQPADRLFMIWGHSHLLGIGWRGWINARKRQIKDRMLGYLRWSAYELDDERLRQAGQAILQYRPAYIIGYSTALDRLARTNREHANAFRQLNLKAVIATAESFPHDDSDQVLENVFGCPVAMEYGAVETGPVAYRQPTGEYVVFWRDYLLEGIPSEHVEGAYELAITSLYPRSFPLVRYRIGDLVIPSDGGNTRSLICFQKVLGRCNDLVELPDGVTVHSVVFTHAIKEFPSIQHYQVVQGKDGNVAINYTSSEAPTPEAVDQIRTRLRQIHPALNQVQLQAVESLDQTIAGKTRIVVRED